MRLSLPLSIFSRKLFLIGLIGLLVDRRKQNGRTTLWLWRRFTNLGHLYYY